MAILDETVLDTAEAAALLACDPESVRRYCLSGQLECVRVGGRWKTSVEAVQRFVRRGTEAAVPGGGPWKSEKRRKREQDRLDSELEAAGW